MQLWFSEKGLVFIGMEVREDKEADRAQVFRGKFAECLVRDWVGDDGIHRFRFADDSLACEIEGTEEFFFVRGCLVDEGTFVKALSSSETLPGRSLQKGNITFVIRVEAADEKMEHDKSVVTLGLDDILSRMGHIDAPTLKTVLKSCDSRVDTRGGCQNVKFRGGQMEIEWRDFSLTVQSELEANGGSEGKKLLQLLQKRRKDRQRNTSPKLTGSVAAKGEEKKHDTLPVISALVMAGNEKVAWNLKGSQEQAAPLDKHVFVTFYQSANGDVFQTIRDVRLFSKVLKCHSIEFQNRECHRLMCVSRSFPLDLVKVIRHASSNEALESVRSKGELRWAKSMQSLLLKPLAMHSSERFERVERGLKCGSDSNIIFMLFTWNHTFHLICEQAIATQKKVDLKELEYTFFLP